MCVSTAFADLANLGQGSDLANAGQGADLANVG